MIDLGAYVETDLGEGCVVGRSLINVDSGPMYTVELFSGKLCFSFLTRSGGPVFHSITVIDPVPMNNPKVPEHMRRFVAARQAKHVAGEPEIVYETAVSSRRFSCPSVVSKMLAVFGLSASKTSQQPAR